MWYVGHWGFQHYCERAGMKPLVAGATVARAGDFVVLPVYPDSGFYRPYAGFAVTEPGAAGEVVAEVVWDDPLSAQTVPNFYGGSEPVVRPRPSAAAGPRVPVAGGLGTLKRC